MTPRYTPAYKEKITSHQSRGQYIDPASLDTVLRLQSMPNEALAEIAEKIRTNDSVFPSPMVILDAIMRAFELMTEDYPNLMLFRGTSFDPHTKYGGIDFAPANLQTAMEYAEHMYDGVRPNPVIVMLPLKDFVRAYLQDTATVGTEGDWDRNSLEVGFKGGLQNRTYPQSLKIFRLPQTHEEKKALLERFSQVAISL